MQGGVENTGVEVLDEREVEQLQWVALRGPFCVYLCKTGHFCVIGILNPGSL